jgi:asparagine N-glycosylation enzyme membrane subunit Stt3
VAKNKASSSRVIEWIFAVLAAFVCTIVPAQFTLSELTIPFRGFQDIFPTPGVYFIEITLLGVACLVAVYKDHPDRKSLWNSVPWICAGITLAFVILGAWTIGFFLIPALIAFIIVGILMDRRKEGDSGLHFIYLISSGVAQSLIVLLAVSI